MEQALVVTLAPWVLLPGMPKNLGCLSGGARSRTSEAIGSQGVDVCVRVALGAERIAHGSYRAS